MDNVVKLARVLLADDHSAILAQTARLLEGEFEILGTVGNGLDGIEAARRLLDAGCRAKLVFFTVHEDPDYVRAGMDASGAGPVLLYPTATDDALGTEKFGLGPTAVLLKQEKGWTYGVPANHLWSVAGEGDRADVNATFLQPFISFTTKKFTTFGLNTESTYD
jgi:hypothetical protein